MNPTPPQDVLARVRAFLVSNFYVPDAMKLGDGDSLVEGGIVDSTGILEVIAFIEREFAVRVEDAETVPANLDSIANIVAFVGKKQAMEAAA
jgi:acyl carrier protein